MSRRSALFGFACVGLLLCVAVLDIILHLFPGFFGRLLSPLDVRQWSAATWWNVNVGALLLLLGIRFAQAALNSLRRGADERADAKGTATDEPKRTRWRRQSALEQLKEDDLKRRAARKTLAVRGSLIAAAVALTAVLGWRGIFGGAEDTAAVYEPLYRNHPGGLVNESGLVGGEFYVRSDRDVEVTHLGFYDSEGNGLDLTHRVGLFEVPGLNRKATLLGEVTFSSGKNSLLRDGYRWEPLPAPITLRAGRPYILAAYIAPGGRDGFPYAWHLGGGGEPAEPEWNPYFVDTVLPTSKPMREYGEVTWPNAPTLKATEHPGTFYGAMNLARMTTE